MDNYNEEVVKIAKEANGEYNRINKFVMDHTTELCETDPILTESIRNTNAISYIVYDKEPICGESDKETTNIIVSKKRTFEAAQSYIGKKVAVLNFANNHSIGGSPWKAGAQEESLCRTSTLYSCLRKFKETFYMRHRDLYVNDKMDYWGNSDIIYLPDVTVFKTDESAPKLMDSSDWYNVDVITSAAPDLGHKLDVNKYRTLIYKRLKKIIQVAKKEKVEVLILGAYGCGAFNNPPEIVASIFKMLLRKYHFDTVEFAVYSDKDDKFSNYNIFKNILES